MSNGPEEFEQLRRLLKLKRHEQPPPGYFEHFSTRILNRIEARRDSPAPFWESIPLLGRFVRLLENNALAAGGFATSVCALLLGGIVYSEYVDQAPAAVMPGADGTMLSTASAAPLAALTPMPAASGSGAGLTMVSSTNGIFGPGPRLAPTPSPFDNFGSLSVQPVSYVTGQ